MTAKLPEPIRFPYAVGESDHRLQQTLMSGHRFLTVDVDGNPVDVATETQFSFANSRCESPEFPEVIYEIESMLGGQVLVRCVQGGIQRGVSFGLEPFHRYEVQEGDMIFFMLDSVARELHERDQDQ